MPSRGIFRGVSSVLFDDPDYQRLPSRARLLLLTLRLCHDAGLAVIFEYSTDKLMRQTGLDPVSLEQAFRSLERRRWIVRERHLVWVVNGLRYDPLVRLADPKHKSAILRWLNALPRLPIVLRFCDYYKIARPFGDPPQGSPQGSSETPLKEKEKSKGIGEGEVLGENYRIRGEGESTAPDVAFATRSGRAAKPPKGRYDQIRAALALSHPDWLPDRLDRSALHQFHQETRHE